MRICKTRWIANNALGNEARIALLPFSFFPGFNFGPGTVRAKALKEPSVKKHFLYSKSSFYDVTRALKGLNRLK